MFSKRIHNIWHKLAFRLTLWYAIIFIASLFGALVVFFVMATNVMQKQIDSELLDDLHEVAATLPFVGANSPEKAIQIEEGDGKIFLRLLDPIGKEIATSKMKYWNTMGINTNALSQINAGVPHIFVTQTIPGRTQKIRVLYGLVGPGKILQIGISVERETQFISTLKATIAPIMIFFVLFSAVLGWFMANHALSGVAEVTKTALDISKGAFGRRVYIKSKSDEIELLANTFNRMLDHINDLMKGLKEVTDNIAHDLKTPITRIRVAAEMELSKTQCDDNIQDLAAGTVEECDNLLQMINTMLMISKEESGISEAVKKSVDMSKIIKEAFELFSPVAEGKGIHLLNQVSDNVVIIGDFYGLQRMIINLLENAVKYTSEGGRVTISLYVEQDNIRITINDTGIGISEEDIPHIFRRLYRCDRSRSQQGFGLGLSLAIAVAHAHNGDVTATSQLGKGSTFTVTLPRLFSSR
jgi:signal transduction histidine kinase